MSVKCLHKNIKITNVLHYKIEKGWEWLQELDDVDMADYFINEEIDKTICEDCAEVLEE